MRYSHYKSMKIKTIVIAFVWITLSALSVVAQTNDPNITTTPPGADTGLADLPGLIMAMATQIVRSPASLMVIIGLSIISAVIEYVEWANSKLILPFCVFGGMFSYWIFAAQISVPNTFPYPHAVLAVNGLICGLVSFTVHAQVIKRFFMTDTKPTDKK